jgi:dTDP-L-rhamnose 4-epimerase
MRVLVTGSAGFIGSHVVAALAAASHDVVGLDLRRPVAHSSRPVPPADTIVGDVREGDTVSSALRDVDAVVHLAAMVGMGVDLNDLPRYASCNDFGTAVLLAAMARAHVHHLVLASSMVVYGEGRYTCARHGDVHPAPRTRDDLMAGQFEHRCGACAGILRPALVDEDARLEPRSGYAATKLAQEHLAAVWTRECDGTTVALRLHNVYGPGMPHDTPYAGVASIFRSSLARGDAPQVFEDGRQRRDFVHVADVASAHVVALRATAERAGFRPYNVASGESHTVAEMAATMAAACGGPSPVITARYRAGDVRHITASPARAERELGFVARRSFADGMAEFAAERPMPTGASVSPGS